MREGRRTCGNACLLFVTTDDFDSTFLPHLTHRYVPLAVIQLGLLEAAGDPKPALHVLGAGLVAARGANAAALSGFGPVNRVPGTLGTIVVVTTMSLWLVAKGVGL